MTETPSPHVHASPSINHSAVPMAGTTRLWMLTLVAGIMAGLTSWIAGEAVVEHFKPETHREERYGVERTLPTAKSLVATEIKNAALAFAILGGALGLALGLAGGLARGSLRLALRRSSSRHGPLCRGRHHRVICAGACVPDAVRHGRSGIDRSLAHTRWDLGGHRRHGRPGHGNWPWRLALDCLLSRGWPGGRCSGAVAYELAGAVVFPLDKTYQPLSETASSRLLGRLTVAFCVAAGAVLATQFTGAKSPRSSPT